MGNFWISLIIGMLILAAAIPYVARIRHPEQKPLAAYLIFVTVFILVAVLLFSLLGWLVTLYELGQTLSRPGPAMLFLIMVFLPAILLAGWLARKPPWRQGPPP